MNGKDVTEGIDIGEDDLTKFFSMIEISILDTLWEHDEVTISDLVNQMGLAQTTVISTLDRLISSGFVDRYIDTSAGRIRYLYSASASREETVIAINARIRNCLIDSFGDFTVDEFQRTTE